LGVAIHEAPGKNDHLPPHFCPIHPRGSGGRLSAQNGNEDALLHGDACKLRRHDRVRT
jgi:hypothetical protein